MNNTRFKDGRLGIGKTPIFPLDVSGNTRIEGDLVLNGTIADGSGVPIYFGHAGVTSTDGSNNIYHIGINRAVATDANFPLDVSGNINIDNGSLYINGEIAEFSNWTDIGETEESGIYRNSKVAIGKTTANHTLDVSGTVNIDGDILLNGTTMDPNPSVPALQAYTDTGPTWKNETIVTTVASSSDTTQALTTALNLKADKASPEFSGNVGIGLTANTNYALDISGDINLTGELKLNGSAPVYSNWTIGGTDIFRNSKVTIGQGNVNTNYQLYVHDNTHINGTLSATTLDGNLAWSNITSKPTTITTTQASNITTNNAKVGITTTQASNITTNNDKVGITTTQASNITTNNSKVSSQWVTGSSSKIYYNSGNVGIGTTNPDNLLHLKGSYPIQVEHDTNSTLKLFINYNQIHTEGNNNLYLNYNSQKDVLICGQGGNVGIGTTSPDSKLHVNGNITLDACRTGSSYPTGSVGGGISFRAGAAYVPDSSNGAYNCSILTYAHDQSTDGLSINGYDGVSFCTGSSTRNERMRINSSGNVGIGTIPGYKLTVQTGTNYDGIILINEDGNVLCKIARDSVKTHAYCSLYDGTNNLVRIDTNGNTFFNGGNVGIGTTIPSTQLTVYKAGTEAAWKGMGYFGNEVRGAVIGVYDNQIKIGGHNAALDAWANIYLGDGASIYQGTTLIHSDDRIKHNEKPVTNVLETINKLTVKTYFKTHKMHDASHNFQLDISGNPITDEKYEIETGIIAQQVRNIPELAYCVDQYSEYDASGNEQKLHLKYQDIFCYNVAAVQELSKKVETLEVENAELKAKLQSIEQRLAFAGF
jgi:hypothetical protein